MAYGGYKGRCIGRLMEFLYRYDHMSDEAKFNLKDNEITLFGKRYATYSWDNNTDVPTFIFIGEFSHLDEEQNFHKAIIIEDNGVNEICKNCNFGNAIVKDIFCEHCISKKNDEERFERWKTGDFS